MNIDSIQVVVFLIGQFVVAAAIWGGIRADLKNMHFRLAELERRFAQVIDAATTWHGPDRRHEERRRSSEDD